MPKSKQNFFFACSFIYSGHFYSAPSSPLLLTGAPHYGTDTVSEFHAEAHRKLQVKNLLAQGFYVADKAGVKPATLRLRVIDLTNAPPRPTQLILISLYLTRSYVSNIILIVFYLFAAVRPQCLTDVSVDRKSCS